MATPQTAKNRPSWLLDHWLALNLLSGLKSKDVGKERTGGNCLQCYTWVASYPGQFIKRHLALLYFKSHLRAGEAFEIWQPKGCKIHSLPSSHRLNFRHKLYPIANVLGGVRGPVTTIAISFALLLATFSSCANAQTRQWAWMGGTNSQNQPGVYGTLGTPAAGNIPGSRSGAITWTDSNGNFWLFGGQGYDSASQYGTLNDIWQFNPLTREWTWISGSSTLNCPVINGETQPCGQTGVYGTLGTPAAGNTPGGRALAASWTDASGNLWLFGGSGLSSVGTDFNDLWEFNPSLGEWTWMGGSSTPTQSGSYGMLGTPAAGNIPSSRYSATASTDSSGNFWLFGGYGTDNAGNQGPLDDLWEFNPSTREWVWISGSTTMSCSFPRLCVPAPGVYGTQGSARRRKHTGWPVLGLRLDRQQWQSLAVRRRHLHRATKRRILSERSVGI